MKQPKKAIDRYIRELKTIISDMETADILIARRDFFDLVQVNVGVDKEELKKAFPTTIRVPLLKCVLDTKKEG